MLVATVKRVPWQGLYSMGPFQHAETDTASWGASQTDTAWKEEQSVKRRVTASQAHHRSPAAAEPTASAVACHSLNASSGAGPQLVLTPTHHALQVLLYGRGLDVSTTARVQALGEVWCDTQVVQRPEPTPRTEQEAASPEAQPSLLRRRQHPVQHSRAAAGLVSRHLVAVAALLLHRLLLRPAQLMRQAQPMVLEVLVPGAVVRRLQLQQPEADATGLTVHLQSDFQSASLPVVFRQLQQQLSPTAAGLAHT